MRLDKERFLNDFECILRSRYGTDAASASVKERYNAASGAVMSALGEVWHGRARLGEGKRAGYLSAEFLIGRAVFANLTNAGVLDEVRAALGEKGVELADFEEVEDAALGNGGLGRLAACYLESAATHNLPWTATGFATAMVCSNTSRTAFKRKRATIGSNGATRGAYAERTSG